MKEWHVIQIHGDIKRIVVVVDSTNNRPQAMRDVQHIPSLNVVSVGTLNNLRGSGYTITHF